MSEYDLVISWEQATPYFDEEFLTEHGPIHGKVNWTLHDLRQVDLATARLSIAASSVINEKVNGWPFDVGSSDGGIRLWFPDKASAMRFKLSEL